MVVDKHKTRADCPPNRTFDNRDETQALAGGLVPRGSAQKKTRQVGHTRRAERGNLR